MKSMMKDALILFAITLFAGLILGIVYEVTKEPIRVQEELAKIKACKEVFQSADSFRVQEDFKSDEAGEWLTAQGIKDQTIDEVTQALNAEGNTIGYVYMITTHEGYSGDIKFSMGVTMDGTLNGISILSIAETPGLGMKAEEVLKPQFKDKTVEKFEYTKTGAMADNQIDAISGATITTNAFTNGVNAGLAYFKSTAGGNNDGK